MTEYDLRLQALRKENEALRAENDHLRAENNKLIETIKAMHNGLKTAITRLVRDE